MIDFAKLFHQLSDYGILFLGCLATSNEEVPMAAPLLLPDSAHILVSDIASWDTQCEAKHPIKACLAQDGNIILCQVVQRLVSSDKIIKV